jgi:hypothetical protein
MSNAPRPGTGVQSTLTEDTFQKNYLEGYTQIVPQDLLESKGGHVRYAVDTVRNGRIVSTQYRLGGILTTVDPQLRYLRLYNPYVRYTGATRAGFSWSVQLNRPYNERIRLWYMPPSSRDEIIMFRKLLQQLENGDIKITKVGA